MLKTYVEFNASRDGFVLLKDVTSPLLVVKGGFKTIAEAENWGTENGYRVNRYEEGKLVESLMPNLLSEILKISESHFNVSKQKEEHEHC
jgi:hypothetical protein